MKKLIAAMMFVVSFTALAATQDKEIGICFVSKFDYPNNAMANVYYVLVDYAHIGNGQAPIEQGAKNHEMIAVTVETNVNVIQRETGKAGRWMEGGKAWDVAKVWGYNKEDYTICGKGTLRFVGIRQGRLSQFRDYTFYPEKMLYVGNSGLKSFVTAQKYALLERF